MFDCLYLRVHCVTRYVVCHGRKIIIFLTPISSVIHSLYFYSDFIGLRGDRITIHRNLCISLCLAELLLLFGMDATDNSKLCSVIAGILHFLFLATFAWMLVEGIHVYYMLVKVFAL